MQINEKILAIKENLPFGSYTRISKETGFTLKTICYFFNLKSGFRANTYTKIMQSAENIIKELN